MEYNNYKSKLAIYLWKINQVNKIKNRYDKKQILMHFSYT